MFEWLDTNIDYPLIAWINGFSQRSQILDRTVVDFMMLDSVRLLPIVTAVLVVALMRKSGSDTNRTFVVALGGVFLALLVARIAQNISERPRPIFADIPGFRIPFGTDSDIPADWSSIPSDTAALGFALATAVFLGSRPLGVVCLLWALVVTSLPRIYAGYHYPSDIMAGGAIGVASVLAVAHVPPRRLIALAERAMVRSQPVYYGAVFVILYATATMFFDLRQALSAMAGIVLASDTQ
ncbi:phosphatase PAP2 family protein [Mesorhizobium marinum]|uniref:Phosphatase PAP2 family protein n=1 Tax=Mesorhizobium marinum TaxID=3228790 RepID=A0ABV3R2N1_9HYPH